MTKLLISLKLECLKTTEYRGSKNKLGFGKGRKHVGKRRKCWLQAFAPVSTMLSKCLLSYGHKNPELFGKGLKGPESQKSSFFDIK